MLIRLVTHLIDWRQGLDVKPGEEAEIEDGLARRLIESGQAVQAQGAATSQEEPMPRSKQTATAEPPQHADQRGPQRRRPATRKGSPNGTPPQGQSTQKQDARK